MDVFTFTKTFGIELPQDNIVIIGKNVYYVNDDIRKIRSSINRDVFALGIYLGCEGKYFEPSPGLIDLISKMDGANTRKIVINPKAESLFLYGRNILLNSISKNPNNIKEGIVLIQNEQDENLGYGLFQTQGKDTVIKNLLDKGSYLRDEVKRKKKDN